MSSIEIPAIEAEAAKAASWQRRCFSNVAASFLVSTVAKATVMADSVMVPIDDATTEH